MAFNLASFKTRTLTAVVFVIVMLAGLLWNHWSFLILFTIVHVGCWLEYQKLIGLIDKDYAVITPFHKYGVIVAGWCLMLYFTNDAYLLFGIRLHAIGWWMGLIFIFILPIIELLFAPRIQPKNIAYSAAGLVYISLPLALLIDLRGQWLGNTGLGNGWSDLGWVLPMTIILSLWVNDTMAYIVGSLIGKTPFSKISPKKTWEGTIGGAILCVAVLGLAAWALNLDYIQVLIIASITAVAGTAGDLFESKLKRLANVKDSGHIMPGHGGFLDRFDSLLFAVPFVWSYIALVEG